MKKNLKFNPYLEVIELEWPFAQTFGYHVPLSRIIVEDPHSRRSLISCMKRSIETGTDYVVDQYQLHSYKEQMSRSGQTELIAEQPRWEL